MTTVGREHDRNEAKRTRERERGEAKLPSKRKVRKRVLGERARATELLEFLEHQHRQLWPERRIHKTRIGSEGGGGDLIREKGKTRREGSRDRADPTPTAAVARALVTVSTEGECLGFRDFELA